ncbi:hypothetical protein SIID45300_01520 [Candidatus Magnetaquicoccaceae bacterium FCR-1]|uniref:Uncharacterized protein n=1 Tax=Candidatus Magnetaquiglobus chichijimensis TaxID=3141448 RepID=A0ABQ0C8J1_9PROT
MGLIQRTLKNFHARVHPAEINPLVRYGALEKIPMPARLSIPPQQRSGKPREPCIAPQQEIHPSAGTRKKAAAAKFADETANPATVESVA